MAHFGEGAPPTDHLLAAAGAPAVGEIPGLGDSPPLGESPAPALCRAAMRSFMVLIVEGRLRKENCWILGNQRTQPARVFVCPIKYLKNRCALSFNAPNKVTGHLNRLSICTLPVSLDHDETSPVFTDEPFKNI